MSDVVWYSGEDESWGLCKREDLLVVDVEEFTSEEWAELGSPGEARSDVGVIIAVHERAEARRPAMDVGHDNDGQVIIYTGRYEETN